MQINFFIISSLLLCGISLDILCKQPSCFIFFHVFIPLSKLGNLISPHITDRRCCTDHILNFHPSLDLFLQFFPILWVCLSPRYIIAYYFNYRSLYNIEYPLAISAPSPTLNF